VLRRRLWALTSIACAGASLVLAVVVTINRFPRGLSVLLCLALATIAAWYGVQRRGAARLAGLAAAIVLIAGALALVVLEGKPLEDLLVLVGFAGALAAAGAAFSVHVQLPAVAAPHHPVLFYNPRSGGGKAERFKLAEEASRRGIEPVELHRGDDLEQLVRAAVRNGADALAMAGGDGSQAIVAKVASELALPYACIPAGTRNHFALDLGVDRDDVVGALDAFVAGGERRVDLAEVNGRVFVNNVSLGLYADAVQQAGYRDAKLRTLLDTVPDVVGPDAKPSDLSWDGPTGTASGLAVLVSNNRYRLGRALGSGTRPRLDRGELGIAAIGPEGGSRDRGRSQPLAVQQWSRRTFEVRSDHPVAAGIDGEAAILDPPLRFRSLASALRVRIAPGHPGASPSALEPDSWWQALGALAKLAFGARTTPA
jgi:diacylglycerol kinase family enzyme